jgi:glycosyltransferase involved in cell wall biosynthesis
MGLSPILLSLKYDIPCVVTVHDYWSVCPNRLLLRKDNEICNVDWNYCLNGCVSFTEKIYLNPLLKGVFIKAMQRRAHILSKVKLVAVSNYVKRMLKRAISDSKIEAIYNGVNENEFPQKQPKNAGRIVLYIGGTKRFKGMDHFFQCADLLRKKGIKNKFALTQMAEFFESDGILNLGRLSRSSLIDLYRRAVCVVVPSLWPEPAGLSVIEAMASYKPVVAYRMGVSLNQLQTARQVF